MNKTLIVKEKSFNEFSKGLIREEAETTIVNWSIIQQKEFFLRKEEYYEKELISGYDTIIFETDDVTQLSKIEFTSTFTYKIEPYDDISVKLVLESTNSIRKQQTNIEQP